MGLHQDIDPAGKADVTGAYAPAVREVRRVQCGMRPASLFVSLPVSLRFWRAASLIMAVRNGGEG